MTFSSCSHGRFGRKIELSHVKYSRCLPWTLPCTLRTSSKLFTAGVGYLFRSSIERMVVQELQRMVQALNRIVRRSYLGCLSVNTRSRLSSVFQVLQIVILQVLDSFSPNNFTRFIIQVVSQYSLLNGILFSYLCSHFCLPKKR